MSKPFPDKEQAVSLKSTQECRPSSKEGEGTHPLPGLPTFHLQWLNKLLQADSSAPGGSVLSNVCEQCFTLQASRGLADFSIESCLQRAHKPCSLLI